MQIGRKPIVVDLPLTGGTSHNLLGTNQDIGNVGTDYYQKTRVDDASEPNYSLRSAEEEVVITARRAMA